ncbi:MAG: hypothetical protein M3N14_10335 [Bacteroidota bacterium]|nr:hypothetical protein [Bacteroidota bacterium]
MKRLINLFLAITAIFPALLFAQDKRFVPLTRYPKGDTILEKRFDRDQQWDLYDAIGSLFSKTPIVPKKDSVTKKPIISIVPAFGYTLQSKFAVTLAGNIVFRSTPDSKISTIVINAAYTQTKQIIIPILSNIWTNGNRYKFVGDYRYLKYPQSTYGLGSNSDILNKDHMDYSLLRFDETIFRHIGGNFYAGGGYAMDYHFDIEEKGLKTGAASDYEKYGGASTTVSSGITLNGLFDSRDNSINSSKGLFGAVQYRDNSLFLGSTSRWQSLVIDLRKYCRFPAASTNVIAFWSYNWLVIDGKPPYLDLPSNGWDPFSGTGRGYIQGRFRGTQMVYLESEYRFRLTRNGLLGGVVFVNAQSFSAQQGTNQQTIQPAFGPGIRLKLNKVTKTNIAIDYGIGRQGSRGVFINVGEVF